MAEQVGASTAYPLWVDGAPVPAGSGATFGTFDPATGSRLADVAKAGPADVDRAVRSARLAYDHGPWPRMAPAERAAVLRRIAAAIEAEGEMLAQLESRDTGSTIRKARAVDVPAAAAAFEWCAWWAESVDCRYPAAAGRPGSYLHWQPVGVVAGITPWNFPLLLAAWKVAPALAAGNTCLLKPASFTSLSTLELGRIASECGLPPGVLNILTGPGPVVGAELARHPGVDLVTLTGSDDVGERLRAASAAGGPEVRLDLAGKSANVILDDADLELAATGALWAIFFHNGQVCTAGSRLVVVDKVHDDLLGLLTERAARLRLGDPRDPRTDVGPLISRQHARGVAGHVRKAVAEGAGLVLGGSSPETGSLGADLDAAAYFRPTVLTGVTPDSAVAQEEVFGPVLSVLRVGSEEEAVAVANGTRYRLAAAVWSADTDRAVRVAEQLRADKVWVNDYRNIDVTRPGERAVDSDQQWLRLTNEIDAFRRRHTMDVAGGGRAERSHYDLLSTEI
jgi:acyl-CoA reductase-like NAD-dependent aldehyde dehydrogenase